MVGRSIDDFCLVVTVQCARREQLQEAQYQAAKANLVPCRNCSRRFTPDRIAVHERVCKAPKKSAAAAAAAAARDEDACDTDARHTTALADCRVRYYFYIVVINVCYGTFIGKNAF